MSLTSIVFITKSIAKALSSPSLHVNSVLQTPVSNNLFVISHEIQVYKYFKKLFAIGLKLNYCFSF